MRRFKKSKFKPHVYSRTTMINKLRKKVRIVKKTITKVVQTKKSSTMSKTQTTIQKTITSVLVTQTQHETIKTQHKTKNSHQSVIPIFIITFQRVGVLKTSIESYLKYIKHPIELVISDNHSTYPPLLRYLDELKQSGIMVYRNPTNNPFVNVRNNVQNYLRTHAGITYYVVTDPDIALDPNPGNVLDVYKYLLNSNPKINSVGPMIRINDIPPHYTLKDEVMARHGHIWKCPVTSIQFQEQNVRYTRFPIDSTFALHRAHQAFPLGGRETLPAYRVHAPYTCKHLDWYINLNKIPEDQRVYQNSSNQNIAHWSASFVNNRNMMHGASRKGLRKFKIRANNIKLRQRYRIKKSTRTRR